jgi:hypothetical protein
MTKNYTQNDLVRFIYHETLPNESAEIRHELDTDENLKNEYLLLLKGYSQLTAPQCLPKKSAEDFILNYSKKVQPIAK